MKKNNEEKIKNDGENINKVGKTAGRGKMNKKAAIKAIIIIGFFLTIIIPISLTKNDSLEDAIQLRGEHDTTFSLAEDDEEDWFKQWYGGNITISISIETAESNDYRIELYNSSGALLNSSVSVTSANTAVSEVSYTTILSGEMIYIRVIRISGSGTYELYY